MKGYFGNGNLGIERRESEDGKGHISKNSIISEANKIVTLIYFLSLETIPHRSEKLMHTLSDTQPEKEKRVSLSHLHSTVEIINQH